jgi:MFS transporter, OFA family, oxalate/formate antiporter
LIARYRIPAPAVVMDDFGGKHLSALIGTLYASVAVGTLIGPSVAGFAFDLSRSYSLPIFTSAITSVAAACIIAGIARVRVPTHQEELP